MTHPGGAQLGVLRLVDVFAFQEAADVVAALHLHRQLAFADHQLEGVALFGEGHVHHLMASRRFLQGHHDLHRVACRGPGAAMLGATVDPLQQLLGLTTIRLAADDVDLIGRHTQVAVHPVGVTGADGTAGCLADLHHALGAAHEELEPVVGTLQVDLQEQLHAVGEMHQTHAGILDRRVPLVLVGTPLDGAHDPVGIGIAEHEAHAVNGVGAAVEQPRAELTGHHQHVSQSARGDQLPALLPAQGETPLMTDGQFRSALVTGFDHAVGTGHAHGHRLLADDALHPGSRSLDGERRVQQMPGADADQIG